MKQIMCRLKFDTPTSLEWCLQTFNLRAHDACLIDIFHNACHHAQRENLDIIIEKTQLNFADHRETITDGLESLVYQMEIELWEHLLKKFAINLPDRLLGNQLLELYMIRYVIMIMSRRARKLLNG